MDIQNRRGLKEAARESLEQAAYDPRKLILIHTGASAAVSLLLALMDYVLQQQIGGTGGLSGAGDRAILETAQTVLSVAQMVALAFWQMGYVFVSLRIGRKQAAGPDSLLEGFRQFGPVLRLRLTETMMYMGRGLLCIYLGSAVFSLTPWAAPLEEAILIGTEEALAQALESCMLPLTCVTVAVTALLVIPYAYRLRMTGFVLMDHPQVGAMQAIRMSRILMYRNRIKLLKVDLSFWWFYLLETLVTMIAYGDVLLLLLGVELPWSGDVSYYVFLVLCYVAQMALYWWKGNLVQVTYANCYEALIPKEEK